MPRIEAEGYMPLKKAERIAQSEVIWAILFILLFFIIIRYLIASDKREKKIMDLHEQIVKADSNRREERLMTHLEKDHYRIDHTTHTVGRHSKSKWSV